ncbi:hypothetical protein ACFQJ7_04605 [Halovenus rubra]|uniref:Uncharacterized protein n=2 Tax=Halovenus rubra TaxID=869890 RepID=A0ACC7DYL9_9EURY|nr:hypothetical protein [Halovenus rubra]
MSSGTEHEASPDTLDEPDDVWEVDIEKQIGHDEYDPVGTLSLITVYFLIIAFLWVFMYFVEFLGRGPTVV